MVVKYRPYVLFKPGGNYVEANFGCCRAQPRIWFGSRACAEKIVRRILSNEKMHYAGYGYGEYVYEHLCAEMRDSEKRQKIV
jgi:hypothetical protein